MFSHRLLRTLEMFPIVSMALLFELAGNTSATEAQLEYKLMAPFPQNNAGFGNRLAIVDGNIIVGESGRTGVLPEVSGQAYLFDGETGALKQTFINPITTENSSFGFAVSGGDGQVFIAGLGSSKETVYSFDADSGALNYTIDNVITNPQTDYMAFGLSLAYDEETLIVGAPEYDSGSLQSVGRVYLYNAVSGTPQSVLENPFPNPHSGLGRSSSTIIDDHILVGLQGKVWHLDSLTGTPLFSLENPNSGGLGAFAVNSSIIAVGASNDSSNGPINSGAVYLFDAHTGDLLQSLFSPHSELYGRFGQSVALTSDGNVLVGAWGESVGNVKYAGRVYLFDGNTGELILEVANPEPRTGAGFGWAVDAFGNNLVMGLSDMGVGIPSTGWPVGGPGAVYVYTVVPEPNTLLLVLSVIATPVGRWYKST